MSLLSDDKVIAEFVVVRAITDWYSVLGRLGPAPGVAELKLDYQSDRERYQSIPRFRPEDSLAECRGISYWANSWKDAQRIHAQGIALIESQNDREC